MASHGNNWFKNWWQAHMKSRGVDVNPPPIQQQQVDPLSWADQLYGTKVFSQQSWTVPSLPDVYSQAMGASLGSQTIRPYENPNYSCEICGGLLWDDDCSVITYELRDVPGAQRNLKYCKFNNDCTVKAYEKAIEETL